MSDTLRLVIANVLSGVGMLLNLVSISMKSKRKMVLVQTFLNFCVSTGQIFARGYAGAVQDGVAMVRNIFVLKGWDKKPVKIFFVALAFVLGLVFNNMGWLGLAVVVIAAVYAAAVVSDHTNEKSLKLIIMIMSLVWGVYDFALHNYVKAAGNALSFGMALVYLLRHREGSFWGAEADENPKDREKEQEEESSPAAE